MMLNRRAIIFANGDVEDLPAARAILQPGDTLVSADGGLRHLTALDLLPSLLIGDLDSLPPGRLESLTQAGVRTLRHPTHKDETDLELALHQVIAEGFRTVRIVGALGGRLDQTLANIYLLSDPAAQGVDLRLDDGRQEVFLITREGRISGAPGDVVSLLPLLGEVHGVTTRDLEYPLRGETLYPYKTRGVSNVMQQEKAAVQISSGSLLCIHTRQIINSELLDGE